MIRVFLSSTFRDLAEHREVVTAAVRRLDEYMCVRMEDFGARSWNSADFCAQKVADCDLFVAILGRLYGSRIQDQVLSYTELEYKTAILHNKPRLCFLLSDRAPLSIEQSDDDARLQDCFRKRVNSEVIRDTFLSPDDLAWKVVTAIRNWERQFKPQRNIIENIVLPLPPNPDWVEPYPMQANFRGRASERDILTRWYVGKSQRIMNVAAIAGMGKSALAWIWINRDVLNVSMPGITRCSEAADLLAANNPEGILWWSFQTREARFQGFLNRALHYFSEGRIIPHGRSVQWRIDAFFEAIMHRRFLLVMDGFEQLLRGNWESSSSSTSGPNNTSLPRACSDPNMSSFLRRFAATSTATRLLITARQMPIELEDAAGSANLFLHGMDAQDARNLFLSAGIKGTESEISYACRKYGYHPLSLRLLVGLCTRDPETPFDIRTVRRLRLLPSEGSTTTVLSRSYFALSNGARRVLGVISAIRGSATFNALRVAFPQVSDERIKSGFEELIEAGLVWIDTNTMSLGLHAVVKQFAYSRIKTKRQTHFRLRQYYLAHYSSGNRNSDEHLQLGLELFHHTISASLYEDAEGFFWEKLYEPLYLRAGDYWTCIELILPLSRWRRDKQNRKGKQEEARVINLLSRAYSHSGEFNAAASFGRKAVEICQTQSDATALILALVHWAHVERILGHLKCAMDALRQAVVHTARITDQEVTAFVHAELGRLLGQVGRFAEAGNEFDRAQALLAAFSRSRYLSILNGHRALVHLYEGHPNLAVDCARNSLSVALDLGYEHDLIRAKWVLGKSLILVAQRSPSGIGTTEAEELLNAALVGCHESGLLYYEPEILLCLAHNELQNDRIAWADALSRDAMELADRCGNRLSQADSHLFRAWLYLRLGRVLEAKHEADNAFYFAQCDGEGNTYVWPLIQASELISSLTSDFGI